MYVVANTYHKSSIPYYNNIFFNDCADLKTRMFNPVLLTHTRIKYIYLKKTPWRHFQVLFVVNNFRKRDLGNRTKIDIVDTSKSLHFGINAPSLVFSNYPNPYVR